MIDFVWVTSSITADMLSRLVPLAFWLGRSWIEVALLAGSVVIVMVVELLNTAVEAAIDHAVPMHVIAASLFARFQSRQDDSPAMKAIAAMRNQFGGHATRSEAPPTTSDVDSPADH